MNITTLKNIDRILGSTLVWLLPPSPAELLPHNNPLSILIIRPGGIGDAVHLIPVIRAIRDKFPDAAIDILAEKRNAEIFTLTGDIRTVIRYDAPKEFFSLFSGKYDVVIDTEQWHRLSAVVARLISGKVRIGFGTNERSRLFNHSFSYAHNDYEALSFMRLLGPLGIDYSTIPTIPWLTLPSNAEARADELLQGLKSGKFVTIFPGASIQERRWGAKRFRSVAQLLSKAGITTVVVGAGEEVGEGEEILKGLKGINLSAKTSLQVTAAVIKRCSVLLSGDSGILHVGVGLGIPTVSLFGSGISGKWAPRGDLHVIINRNLACSPCTKFGYTPKCKIGAKCISDISADEVHSAIISLLNLKAP